MLFSSELDPNEEVKFDAALTAYPPRSRRFQKVNALEGLAHGFPLVESLEVLKELTFRLQHQGFSLLPKRSQNS